MVCIYFKSSAHWLQWVILWTLLCIHFMALAYVLQIYIGPKEEIFAVEMPEGVDGLGQAVLGQFPTNSLPGS